MIMHDPAPSCTIYNIIDIGVTPYNVTTLQHDNMTIYQVLHMTLVNSKHKESVLCLT